MRKFYLENEYGQRYDFQRKNQVFLSNPSDLGFSIERSYTSVGTRYLILKESRKQKEINAKISFLGDYYKLFRELSDYIHSSKKIKLIYEFNSIEYFLDIDVSSLSKGEADDEGMILESNIKFMSKSLYYRKKENKYVLESKSGGSRWDVLWDFVFLEETNTSIEISNQGQTDSSFDFEIYGYVENPVLKVYYDNALVNSITFNLTIELNEVLRFSNSDDDIYCQLVRSDGSVENVFDSLNINNNNFFKLQKGSSNLVFSGNQEISKINFAYYEEYESI